MQSYLGTWIIGKQLRTIASPFFRRRSVVGLCAPSVLRGPVCRKTISQMSRHLSLCCLCPWFCLCRHNKLGKKPFFALLLAGIPGRNWIERTQRRSRTFCLFTFWPNTAGHRHVVFVYWRKKSWLSNKGKRRRRAKGGKAKSGIKTSFFIRKLYCNMNLMRLNCPPFANSD